MDGLAKYAADYLLAGPYRAAGATETVPNKFWEKVDEPLKAVVKESCLAMARLIFQKAVLDKDKKAARKLIDELK